MKHIFIVLLIVVTGCFVSGCSDKPSESLAKEIFEKKVLYGGDGCIKVIKFTKTNGMDQNIMGAKLYEIDYDATIKVVEECYLTSPDWKGISAVSVAKWAKEDHSLFGVQMKPMWGVQTAVGVTRDISGKMYFQKSENGWIEAK